MAIPSYTTILAGQTVTIRAIRKTDSTMEVAFVKGLSSEARRFRFFGGVNELPADEIKKLCDTDGAHSMAYVATVQEGDYAVEIGVCRYVQAANTDVRELAVTIADEWLHKGLGKVLMEHLIASAKTFGVKQLYSLELVDNSMMRELAQEIGMSARRDPDDAHQIIYSLSLANIAHP